MSAICDTYDIGTEVSYNNPGTGRSFTGNVIKRHSCKTSESLTLANNSAKFIIFGDKIQYLSIVN